MNGYLGEFPVDISTTKYKDYTRSDWALVFIEKYGGIDGDHHKKWVIDQAVRCLKGVPIVVVEARWDNGFKEYRIWTDEKGSDEYRTWVKSMTSGVNEGYDYDEGIAP